MSPTRGSMSPVRRITAYAGVDEAPDLVGVRLGADRERPSSAPVRDRASALRRRNVVLHTRNAIPAPAGAGKLPRRRHAAPVRAAGTWHLPRRATPTTRRPALRGRRVLDRRHAGHDAGRTGWPSAPTSPFVVPLATSARTGARSATSPTSRAASPPVSSAAACSAGRTGRVPAAELARGRGHVLGRSRSSARCPVPIVHFYGPKEVGFILRQSRARVLVTADRFGHLDYLANLDAAPPGRSPRSSSSSSSATRARRRRLVRRARGGRSDRRPVADRPVGAGARRLHVGHDGRPEGRRALAPHDRLRDPPARRADAERAAARSSSARRSGTAIGMLAALLHPRLRAATRSTSSTCGTRARVLAAMLEDHVSSGSGLDLSSSRACSTTPTSPAEHAALMRASGSAARRCPAAVGERADALGHLDRAQLRVDASTRRSPAADARRAAREAPLHRRPPMAGVEIRLRRRRRQRRSTPGEPGEIWSRGPDCFLGYTDPALTREVSSTPTVGTRPATSACSTTTATSRSSTARRTSSSAAARTSARSRSRSCSCACRAWPRSRWWRRPTRASASTAARSCGCCPTAATSPTLVDVDARAPRARRAWRSRSGPRTCAPIDEFPRTPSGKIQKFVLRQRLRDE